MTKPVALTVYVAGIPEVLRALLRWVLWCYVLRDGRWTKAPYRPSGGFAKSDDPSTWCSFDEALTAYRTGRFDGVGFVLGDGWAGIDIDHCYVDTYTGAPTEEAQGLLNRLAQEGIYNELSPSETGVKAIGRSARIGGEVKFSTTPPTFTAWAAARFFTITGRGLGDSLADLTPLIDEWFPPAPAPLTLSSTREGYTLAAECTDDDLLIAMIAGDTNGDDILALWRGDTSGYGNDHSRADLALCCHLAFWTNYDVARVDRLFRQSGLMRQKWEHTSYRRATLAKALQ